MQAVRQAEKEEGHEGVYKREAFGGRGKAEEKDEHEGREVKT